MHVEFMTMAGEGSIGGKTVGAVAADVDHMEGEVDLETKSRDKRNYVAASPSQHKLRSDCDRRRTGCKIRR